MRLHASILLALSLVASCTYEPTYELACSDEGAVEGGRQCIDGVWVATDAGSGPADADGCEPPADDVACAEQAAECGDILVSACDAEQTVSCGTCAANETCDANSCVCVPETEEELCEAVGATCGTLSATDRCGTERDIDCGQCSGEDVCGAGGTPNTCACPGADDVAFCMANDAVCGVVTANDPICQTERTVNCGECNAPETCGGADVPNQCGCTESDDDFCARLQKNCGLVSGMDACDMPRTDVDCGECTAPESCGGGSTANVCGCDAGTVCVDVGAQCGMTDVSSECANLDMVDCGDCGANGTCMQAACACDDGYAVVGTECLDVDECATNADDCDANATCTNEPGTFSCACDDGFSGDGTTCTPLEPTIAEMVTGTGTDPVVTDPITGVEDDLYVAFVSVRTTSRTIDTVGGLGLTWTEVDLVCNASDEQRIGIWWARGTPQVGSDAINVDISGEPYGTAVAVFRVTNVPASGSPGEFHFENSNGPMGACNSSNPDTSYSFDYDVVDDNALLLAGTAIHARSHTAGAMWTEETELHKAGTGGRNTGMAVESRTSSAMTVTVDGSFNGINNWVTGVMEVRGL